MPSKFQMPTPTPRRAHCASIIPPSALLLQREELAGVQADGLAAKLLFLGPGAPLRVEVGDESSSDLFSLVVVRENLRSRRGIDDRLACSCGSAAEQCVPAQPGLRRRSFPVTWDPRLGFASSAPMAGKPCGDIWRSHRVQPPDRKPDLVLALGTIDIHTDARQSLHLVLVEGEETVCGNGGCRLAPQPSGLLSEFDKEEEPISFDGHEASPVGGTLGHRCQKTFLGSPLNEFNPGKFPLL